MVRVLDWRSVSRGAVLRLGLVDELKGLLGIKPLWCEAMFRELGAVSPETFVRIFGVTPVLFMLQPQATREAALEYAFVTFGRRAQQAGPQLWRPRGASCGLGCSEEVEGS